MGILTGTKYIDTLLISATCHWVQPYGPVRSQIHPICVCQHLNYVRHNNIVWHHVHAKQLGASWYMVCPAHSWPCLIVTSWNVSLLIFYQTNQHFMLPLPSCHTIHKWILLMLRLGTISPTWAITEKTHNGNFGAASAEKLASWQLSVFTGTFSKHTHTVFLLGCVCYGWLSVDFTHRFTGTGGY